MGKAFLRIEQAGEEIGNAEIVGIAGNGGIVERRIDRDEAKHCPNRRKRRIPGEDQPVAPARPRFIGEHLDEPEQQKRRGKDAARHVGVAQDREDEAQPQAVLDTAVQRREREHDQRADAVVSRHHNIIECAQEAE
jgi:hypothetical protein